MTKTVCVDLDGTLANIDHRLKYVQTPKPNWEKFYAECVNDKVNIWCKELILALLGAGIEVRIVTARPINIMAETWEWIERNVVNSKDRRYKGLFLDHVRDEGDFTPDQDLKKYWLQDFERRNGKQEILFVVDDRARVVSMWRSMGLTCLQCADWQEYKRPKKVKQDLEEFEVVDKELI